MDIGESFFEDVITDKGARATVGSQHMHILVALIGLNRLLKREWGGRGHGFCVGKRWGRSSKSWRRRNPVDMIIFSCVHV